MKIRERAKEGLLWIGLGAGLLVIAFYVLPLLFA